MNRYLSVFGLAARSTLVKLIGVIIVMGAVQAGMFLYALNNAGGPLLLEYVIYNSRISFAFGFGFIAYYAVLCGMSKNTSNAVMTMHRLSMQERTANWVTVVYNIMALTIFLAAELAICLALFKVYLNSDVSGSYQHVLFTAFYRSNLLHALLPLEDYITWAADILLVIEMSVIAAYAQMQHRRGKHDFVSVAAMIAAVLTFPQDSSDPGITGSVIFTCLAIYTGIQISKGGAVDEDYVYMEESTDADLAG